MSKACICRILYIHLYVISKTNAMTHKAFSFDIHTSAHVYNVSLSSSIVYYKQDDELIRTQDVPTTYGSEDLKSLARSFAERQNGYIIAKK